MTFGNDEAVKLRERIEDLEFELAEMKGAGSGRMQTRTLADALGVQPKCARLAIILSGGRAYSKEQLLYRMDASDSLGNVIAVYVHKLRAAGLKISTRWGVGFEMSPESCERVKALLKAAQ